MLEMLKKTHEEVKRHIERSSARYKSVADQHKRYKEFKVGNKVLMYLRKERFLTGTYNKLKYKKFGLCRVIRKCGANAYQVDLPGEFDITPVFNISDLYLYSEDDRTEEPAVVEWQKQLPRKKREQVKEVLDRKVAMTRGSRHKKYLVKWVDLPYEGSTWISEEELKA
eukprot:Gb_25287 [translate_table: standard]